MNIILLIILYFSILFLVGTMIKNNSIVEIGWGVGFIIVAWFAYYSDPSIVLGQWIITFLVTLWGIRLFYHMIRRNFGKSEDLNYANVRRAWGKWVIPRSFLQVYILQGLFLYIISLTVIQVAYQGIDHTEAGEQIQINDHRTLELNPSSGLLWRSSNVVGYLPNCR
ncbi:MAG: conserved rane protein of unknown function [Herbinix sp.]|nr:conserved rane protein of unknown function [Herbinix sp.]